MIVLSFSVIQYGFVVFFVAGFPLAPVLALFNNIFEIRVDASKLTKNLRRPVPKKVSGLGAWFSILQGVTYLGVVTNVSDESSLSATPSSF